MSYPQPESAANHRSSAPPIKNRQFFVKVFYLSVFCKVVFGEIKSNRRILRFFSGFPSPRALSGACSAFFCRRADLSLSQGSFAFQMLRTRSSEHIFGLPPRFPVLRLHLRSGHSPPTPSCALQAPPTIRAPHALKARNSPHSPPLRPARDDSLLLSHARCTDAFHADTLVSALPHPSRARMANRTHKSSSPAPLLRVFTFPVCLVAHTE